MPRTMSKALSAAILNGMCKDTRLTIHVAEATCLALLGVMKTSSPVDCDVAFATVQSSGAFHATTGTDTTKLEEPIKDRAIISDVVFSLLLGKRLHVVGSDLLEEVDILVGVELGHLMTGSRFCALRIVRSCA